MDMNVQVGMDMHRGKSHATWTGSMDMAWTCSMDMDMDMQLIYGYAEWG